MNKSARWLPAVLWGLATTTVAAVVLGLLARLFLVGVADDRVGAVVWALAVGAGIWAAWRERRRGV